MEDKVKYLSVIIVIIVIILSVLYLMIPKPTHITAIDGLAKAEKIANEWKDDAVLFEASAWKYDYINGTSDAWEYTFISPSTRYNVTGIFPEQLNGEWAYHHTIIVYANGTIFNNTQPYYYLPTYSNTTQINNWLIDSDEAFHYIVEKDDVFQYLANVSDHYAYTGYWFNSFIRSENNVSFHYIQLNIYFTGLFETMEYSWKIDVETGDFIESTFSPDWPELP